MPALGILGADLPDRLHALQLGHAQVHERDVGPQAPPQGDRLFAVAGFADHHGVLLHVDDRCQPAPDQRVVVGDQHADAAVRGRRLAVAACLGLG